MSLIDELKRRNVFKVGAAYLTAIHIAFLLSAMAIAACDRIMPHPESAPH